jgi:hypothetical protein
MLSLTVPYPLRGFRYFIVWPLPVDDPETGRAKNLRMTLLEQAQIAVEAFMERIANEPWFSHLSVSLYSPVQKDGKTILTRAAHTSGAMAAKAMPPQKISLRGDGIAYLQAWWGDMAIKLSQTRTPNGDAGALDAGVLDGERWLFVLPVQELGAKAGAKPSALLRIGISDDAVGIDTGDIALILEELKGAWNRGMLSMLNAMVSNTTRR